MTWLFAKRIFLSARCGLFHDLNILADLVSVHMAFTHMGFHNKGLGEGKRTNIGAITMDDANSHYMRVMKLTVMGLF